MEIMNDAQPMKNIEIVPICRQSINICALMRQLWAFNARKCVPEDAYASQATCIIRAKITSVCWRPTAKK
uniref:Uncharacterized protein n=1 Tax=Romanomermis culicivorax TaxID=13658 RepID=A0A915J697_ROMCU